MIMDGFTFCSVPDSDAEALLVGIDKDIIERLGPPSQNTILMNSLTGKAYCRATTWQMLNRQFSKRFSNGS